MGGNLPSRRGGAARWGAAAATCLLLLVLTGVWLGRQQLVQGAADRWVRNVSIRPADAVAVLGGGVETRPAMAASYLRNGMAHKILVSNVDHANGKSFSRHTRQNLAELAKLGVSNDVVEVFGCNLTNTYSEVLALRTWSLSTGTQRLIVPTEYFSARRLRWVVQSVFQGTGVEVQVPVISSLDYLKGEWWNNIDALWTFQREVFKYLGYRVIYGLRRAFAEPVEAPRSCQG
jgi:hypothetical protein